MPTSEGTETPLDLVVWGSPLCTSQPDEGVNILTPLDIDTKAIDASAGTQYSIIVLPDGNAWVTGFIPDPNGDAYQGHMGIRPQDLVEGQNAWIEVSRVFDQNSGGVTFPPRFKKAFAGVENTPGEGDIHTVFVDGRGNAWSTGSNDVGQLCLGDTVDRLLPTRIEGVKNVVDVAVGGQHTLLLTEDGTIYGCGSNEKGQLGLGDTLPNTIVPLELYLLEAPAATVSAGKDHSLVMTKDGDIYAFGCNCYKQLCVDTGSEEYVYTPRAIDIDEKVVTSFEATMYSSYLLYVDGSVNACGRNDVGQLGDGTNDNEYLVTVAMPTESGGVVQLLGIGPGANSVFFVTEDQTVWATGHNNFGQLGVGDEDDRNLPTLVRMQKEAIVHIISAGNCQSLALKEGGIDITYMPTYNPTPSPVTPVPVAMPTYSPTAGKLPTYR